jgi:hypothetical protein
MDPTTPHEIELTVPLYSASAEAEPFDYTPLHAARLQRHTAGDPPAAFSNWAVLGPERRALLDRLHAACGPSDRSNVRLDEAAELYMALSEAASGPRHTGNQLMPSQTNAHKHPLAGFILMMDGCLCGLSTRLWKRTVIRGSHVMLLQQRDHTEFTSLLTPAPASSKGYFLYR